MTGPAVIGVLEHLAGAGIEAWVGGGWGIDALVGAQTREHADLDLAVPAEREADVIARFTELGFAMTVDWRPVRFAMTHGDGREVDFHPVATGRDGVAIQALLDGESARYPPDQIVTGVIAGRPVRCLSTELQVSFHLGYDPGPKDRADLAALVRSGHLAELPGPYRSPELRPDGAGPGGPGPSRRRPGPRSG